MVEGRDFEDPETGLDFIPDADVLMGRLDNATYDALQAAALGSGPSTNGIAENAVAGPSRNTASAVTRTPSQILMPPPDTPATGPPKQRAQPTVLPAARPRHKSTASTPSDRGVSVTPSIPDSVASSSKTPDAAPASRMDACWISMVRTGDDPLQVFTTLRDLPRDEYESKGLYPRLDPTVDHRCVTCDMDLREFETTKRALDAKIKKVAHTLSCAQTKAREDALPAMQERFNLAACSGFQCTFCPERDNVAGPDSLLKTPCQQSQHIGRHFKEGGMLACSCGIQVAADRSAVRMHMARNHDLWLCWRPQCKALRKIEAVHFDDIPIPFDLENGRAYGNPVEWEERCEELIEDFEAMVSRDMAVGPYDPRDDVAWPKDQVEAMDGGEAARPVNMDLKYYPVAVGKNLAMLQYGTCYWCYHDTTLPASARKHPHTHNLTSYLHGHIRATIERSKTAIEGDDDDDASDAVSYTYGTHSCVDAVCRQYLVAQDVSPRIHQPLGEVPPPQRQTRQERCQPWSHPREDPVCDDRGVGGGYR